MKILGLVIQTAAQHAKELNHCYQEAFELGGIEIHKGKAFPTNFPDQLADAIHLRKLAEQLVYDASDRECRQMIAANHLRQEVFKLVTSKDTIRDTNTHI